MKLIPKSCFSLLTSESRKLVSLDIHYILRRSGLNRGLDFEYCGVDPEWGVSIDGNEWYHTDNKNIGRLMNRDIKSPLLDEVRKQLT
jgi:hypothetical protein